MEQCTKVGVTGISHGTANASRSGILFCYRIPHFVTLIRWFLLAEGAFTTASIPWIVPGAWLGLVCFTSLSLAVIGRAVAETFPIHVWIIQWHRKREAQKAVAEYIPFMLPKDR